MSTTTRQDERTVTAPVNPRRRDWFRILRDLKAAGISYGMVARKVARNPASVQAWADGGDPKESDARVVLALYAKYCPLAYLAHQRHYEIRAEIDAATEPGETRALPFVGRADATGER